MKFKKIVMLGFLQVVLCAPAFAETLTVRVMEKGTRLPVADATVVLGEDTHATTDKHGVAGFDAITGPIPVKILASGFETLTGFVPENKTDVTFYILPLVLSDIGLEVVAERIEEKTSKLGLSVSEFKRVPGSFGDPIRAAQSLPGVTTAGENSSEIYIRGSGQGDTGVWVNRIPVNYLFHIDGSSTLNPDLLADFNLFLGGFPVDYSDHVGGFLDVQLRKPRTNRYYQDYRISVNEAAFMLEGPAGSQENGFFLAGRRSYIDAVLSPEDLTKLINQDEKNDSYKNVITTVPRFADMQGLWHRQLAEGSVQLQYLMASDEVALINNASKDTDPETAGRIQAGVSYHSLGLSWQQKLSRRWILDSALSYMISKQESQFGTNLFTGEPYFVNVDQTAARWQPMLSWQATNRDGFGFGVEASYTEIPIDLYISAEPNENDLQNDFSQMQKFHVDSTIYARSFAPFIKYTRQWTFRLKSTVGLRDTTISGSGGIDAHGLAPRLALEYSLTTETVLHAVWGRYLQLPSTNSQLIKGFGNPKLAMTDAEHRILGIKRRLSPDWSLQAEVYQTPVEKLSVYVADAAPPNNYVNQGEGESSGFDFMLKRDAKAGRSGWLSYSYTHSTRTNNLTGETREYTGDIPHVVNLVWTQPFAGRWRNWQWGAKLSARSGSTYTRVVGRAAICNTGTQLTSCTDQVQPQVDPQFLYYSPIYGKQNGNRFDPYYRLDLRLEKEARFDNWIFNWYLDMQNVTFAKNVDGYDYGKRYEHIDNPKEVRSTPFLPFMGVEFKF